MKNLVQVLMGKVGKKVIRQKNHQKKMKKLSLCKKNTIFAYRIRHHNYYVLIYLKFRELRHDDDVYLVMK